jgi:hypothetical protein
VEGISLQVLSAVWHVVCKCVNLRTPRDTTTEVTSEVPMNIAIVGHEAAKFTPTGEKTARALIRTLLQPGDTLVSGACHLGGIDVWAEEEALRLGLATLIFPPKSRSWTWGYKPRNMQIARHADFVACLVVCRLPDGYQGMRFPSCYHCHTTEHVKSGGCWTRKYAASLGVPGETYIIKQ